jgi:hypothetical protein
VRETITFEIHPHLSPLPSRERKFLNSPEAEDRAWRIEDGLKKARGVSREEMNFRLPILDFRLRRQKRE